jgi:hypothetical protein
MAKKPVTKVEEPEVEVTIEQLVAVAEDFNTFMFTEGEDGIDLDLEYDDLLKEVTELAQDLVDTDTVESETAATLEALQIACPAIVANDSDPVKDDEADETTASQLSADLAVVKKSNKIDKIKEIAKLYKITIPPPFLKDLAKLKVYVVGKLDGSSPAKPKAENSTKVKKVNDGSSLKGPGVIKTIVAAIKENGPITKEGILAILVEKFPDRDAEAMKKTINVQVPNRISKEHDLVIEKTDKGYKVAPAKK